MGYTPHTWSNGETITAAKLNAIEQGVAGSSGYDAEVYLHRESGSSVFTGEVVSGDYASLSTMIGNDIPPSILVRVWDEAGNAKTSLSATAIYSIQNNSIVFSSPYMNGLGISTLSVYQFTWGSNDTIYDIALYLD